MKKRGNMIERKDDKGKQIKEGDYVYVTIRGGQPHFISFSGKVVYSKSHGCFGVEPLANSVKEKFIPLDDFYEIEIYTPKI